MKHCQEDQRIYRFKVVRVFLRTATPLNKPHHFRNLLEENSLRLTDRRQMADLVPLILADEKSLIKEEITDKHLLIIFDGHNETG